MRLRSNFRSVDPLEVGLSRRKSFLAFAAALLLGGYGIPGTLNSDGQQPDTVDLLQVNNAETKDARPTPPPVAAKAVAGGPTKGGASAAAASSSSSQFDHDMDDDDDFDDSHLPEDARKAMEAISHEAANIRVSLPDIVDQVKTTKLFGRWDVNQLFALHHDFDTNQNADQMYCLSDDLRAFKSRYCANVHAIKDNLKQALLDLDEQFQTCKRLSAFQMCNVYLYNSELRKVTDFGMSNFNLLKIRQEELRTAIEDVQRLIKGMTSSEFKTLLETPVGMEHRPYLRSIKSDYPTQLDQQVTAESFAKSAYAEAMKLATDVEIMHEGKAIKSEEFSKLPEDVQKKIAEETLAKRNEVAFPSFLRSLRWHAFNYAVEPPSHANPSDRYAYANQKSGVDSRTGMALRAAVASPEVKELWQRYLKVLKMLHDGDESPGKGPRELVLDDLLRMYRFPGKARDEKTVEVFTWEQFDKKARELVEKFSAALGRRVPILFKQGRVMWANAEKEDRRELIARVYDGGRKYGCAVHCEPGSAKDYFTPRFACAYGMAAQCLSKNHSGLVAPCRSWFTSSFDMEMNKFFEENSPSPYQREHAGSKLRDAFDTLMLLQVLKLSQAMDDFESSVYKECDALGAVTSVRLMSPEQKMPDSAAVRKAWSDSLTQALHVDGITDLKAACSAPLIYARDISLDYENVPLSMRRENYLTQMKVAAQLATHFALHKKDGSWISQQERERLQETLFNAPNRHSFREILSEVYKQDPRDPGFWKSAMLSIFTPAIEQAEKAAVVALEEKKKRAAEFKKMLEDLMKRMKIDSANKTEGAEPKPEKSDKPDAIADLEKELGEDGDTTSTAASSETEPAVTSPAASSGTELAAATSPEAVTAASPVAEKTDH